MASLSLLHTLNNDYYNIDSILMEQENVPCEMRTDIFKLGHLDPSSHERDLKQGARLDLPLWLAEKLMVLLICLPICSYPASSISPFSSLYPFYLPILAFSFFPCVIFLFSLSDLRSDPFPPPLSIQSLQSLYLILIFCKLSNLCK